MEDIRSVLLQFTTKKKSENNIASSGVGPGASASSSEIPDVFFDVVLKQVKLTRHEITLLMFLYRQVWCRPNLYKPHGIGPLNSYASLASGLSISIDDLGTYLQNLEKLGFIQTVRSGQYFVRKYFTDALDAQFGQNYDEFF